MKFGRHGVSYLFLRLGIGLAFLWMGVDMFRHPEAWTNIVSADNFQVTRVVASALGLLFILNYWPRITATAAAICLLFNLFTHQSQALAARDIGLLGVTLAILFWPYHTHRRRWWKRLWPQKKEVRTSLED